MKKSAGLLMFRDAANGVEVLIAHPGGPIFAGRDDGAWTVPKGLIEPGEDPLEAAQREFSEETGFVVTPEAFVELGSVRLKSGKQVTAWAFRGDADPAALASNEFEMEWPRRSGRMRRYPEVDQVEWASPSDAKRKLNRAQAAFVDRLLAALGEG